MLWPIDVLQKPLFHGLPYSPQKCRPSGVTSRCHEFDDTKHRCVLQVLDFQCLFGVWFEPHQPPQKSLMKSSTYRKRLGAFFLPACVCWVYVATI